MPDPQQPSYPKVPENLRPAQLATTEQINDMEERQKKLLREHMAHDQKRLLDQSELTAKMLDDMDLPRLPEHHFMWFLKYFTGEVSTDDGQQAIAKWISIARTPASEVSIIDTGGNELFRVPPLFDTSIINPARKIDQPMGFAQIVMLSMEYGRHLPSRGENFLIGKLNTKQRELRAKSEVHTEYQQRWLEIFKRYGKLRPSDLPTAKNTTDEIGDDELQ